MIKVHNKIAIILGLSFLMVVPLVLAQSQPFEVTGIEAVDVSTQGATVRWVTNQDMVGRLAHSNNQANLSLPGVLAEKYKEADGKYYYQVRISGVELDKPKHFYKIFINQDGELGKEIIYSSSIRDIIMEPAGSPRNPALVSSDRKVVRGQNDK